MAPRTVQGLSLCSGIGGLELAMQLSYGDTYRCVGYCERDSYAASVLVARMEEQALDRAPIWDNLESFPSLYYRNRVDHITAGFPCQPFSAAGRRTGKTDQRWLWPLIAEHVATIGPSIVFLENVPGLRHHGLSEILSDLAALGFNAEWMHLSARDVGLSHIRKRLFLLAYSGRVGWGEGAGLSQIEALGIGEPRFSDPGKNVVSPTGPDDSSWEYYTGPEPSVFREPNGSAKAMERRDRLHVCGNGVVPVVAATAYIALIERAAFKTKELKAKS